MNVFWLQGFQVRSNASACYTSTAVFSVLGHLYTGGCQVLWMGSEHIKRPLNPVVLSKQCALLSVQALEVSQVAHKSAFPSSPQGQACAQVSDQAGFQVGHYSSPSSHSLPYSVLTMYTFLVTSRDASTFSTCFQLRCMNFANYHLQSHYCIAPNKNSRLSPS